MSKHITLAERLNQLIDPANSWYDGDGEAPTTAAIATTRQLLAGMNAKPEQVGLYPDFEGGLEFEWNEMRQETAEAPCGRYLVCLAILADGSLEQTAVHEISGYFTRDKPPVQP